MGNVEVLSAEEKAQFKEKLWYMVSTNLAVNQSLEEVMLKKENTDQEFEALKIFGAISWAFVDSDIFSLRELVVWWYYRFKVGVDADLVGGEDVLRFRQQMLPEIKKKIASIQGKWERTVLMSAFND